MMNRRKEDLKMDEWTYVDDETYDLDSTIFGVWDEDDD